MCSLKRCCRRSKPGCHALAFAKACEPPLPLSPVVSRHPGAIMRIIFVALIVTLGPSLASSQEQEGAVEIAKLEFVEKMYASGADHFRKVLAERGLTDAEIEDVLFKAIDKYSACAVRAAQAQAQEQGLPEDIVLKGVGGGADSS